ncbi:hypothetical protein [Shewanella sp. SR44-3]|uniref:hypothetical protein n=1 Tax=Shewanella sp. SR44-3 TaxID=2760936 RepID=UPI0015FDD932|nr:hypothetical protein [Shewanella sp. SR44-3]MBB1268539.1 hypothetical protein [Shewanella sp. SR44-3]
MSRIYQQYLRSHLAQRRWALTAIAPLMFCSPLLAQDKPVIKLKAPLNSEQTLEAKVDAARDISYKTEQVQLKKARQGDQALQLKAHKILKQQQSNAWQVEQQGKAEQGFKARKSREQSYLKAARQAATQEKKITAPQEAVSDKPAQPKQQN